MIRQLAIIACAFLFGSGLPICVAGGVDVPHTISAPKIDGNLNEPAWANAVEAVGFLRRGGEAPADQSTLAYLMRDDHYLYLAAICRHDRALTPAAFVQANGGAVWTDDSIELFITPDSNESSPVFQIVINSNGVTTGIAHTEGNRDEQWESHARVAAERKDHFWRVEAAIPLASINLTGDQSALFNLTRQHNYVNQPLHLSTWAPVRVASFNDPVSYEPLRLLDPDSKPQHLLVTHSEQAQMLQNNHFERGLAAWSNDGFVNVIEEGDSSGWVCRLSGTRQQASKIAQKAQVEGATEYVLSSLIKYEGLDQPNHVVFHLTFYDGNGKKLDTMHSTGLGNMGGTSRDWADYRFHFTTPNQTEAVSIEARIDDVGIIWLEHVSLVRFDGDDKPRPILEQPEDNAVLHAPPVLKWSYFGDRRITPGTFTVELSTNPYFSSEATIHLPGVYSRPNWAVSEEMHNGKWYWRVRFDGEEGGYWSEPSQFTLHITAENEQIAPRIESYGPVLASDPEEASQVFVRWYDPDPGSGIDKASVQLLIGGVDRTTDAKITPEGLELDWEPSERPQSLTVRVSDRNGNKTEHRWFASTGPAPVTEIDEAGFIRRNGERFFPIAIYAVTHQPSYAVISDAGFNTILSPWGPSERYLQAAHRHNLMIGADSTGPSIVTKGLIPHDSPAGRRALQNSLDREIVSIDHPNLLCYYLGDESADKGVLPEKLQVWHNMLKKTDSRRFTAWLPTYRRENIAHLWAAAADACDMLIRDDYPLFRGASYAELVENMRRVHRWANHKPMWHIIEAFDRRDFGRSGPGRHPTYHELRYQVYSAIVAQGRGVCFYTAPARRQLVDEAIYAETDSPDFREEMFAVARELGEIHDVLILDDALDRVRLSATDIDQLSWNAKVSVDAVWLFLVNTSEEPIEFEASIADGQAVVVYGETHTVEHSGSQFQDQIGGLKARVYRIGL